MCLWARESIEVIPLLSPFSLLAKVCSAWPSGAKKADHRSSQPRARWLLMLPLMPVPFGRGWNRGRWGVFAHARCAGQGSSRP